MFLQVILITTNSSQRQFLDAIRALTLFIKETPPPMNVQKSGLNYNNFFQLFGVFAALVFCFGVSLLWCFAS
jgi:hypothetical protein